MNFQMSGTARFTSPDADYNLSGYDLRPRSMGPEIAQIHRKEGAHKKAVLGKDRFGLWKDSLGCGRNEPFTSGEEWAVKIARA